MPEELILKACPFCGLEPAFSTMCGPDITMHYMHYIDCIHCGVGMASNIKRQLIEAWNQRADLKPEEK